MEEPNVWTFVKQILSKDEKYEYDPKKANSFLLCSILSYDPKSLPIISEINPYIFELDDKVIYNYLFEKIPKGQRYINYIKSQKQKETNNKDLQKLKDDLNLSNEETLHYKKLIEKE